MDSERYSSMKLLGNQGRVHPLRIDTEGKRFRMTAGESEIGDGGDFVPGRDTGTFEFEGMPRVHLPIVFKSYMPSAGTVTSRGFATTYESPTSDLTEDLARYDIIFAKKITTMPMNKLVSDPPKLGLNLQALNYHLHKWTVDGKLPSPKFMSKLRYAGSSVPQNAIDEGNAASGYESKSDKIPFINGNNSTSGIYPSDSSLAVPVDYSEIDVTNPEEMIEYVSQNWGLVGSLNNTKGDMRSPNGMRVLNIIKHGNTALPNVYGKGTLGGKHLHFIITFVPVSGDSTVYYPHSNGTAIVLPNKCIKENVSFKHVCRIVPVWTNERKVPPKISDLSTQYVEPNPRANPVGHADYVPTHLPKNGHGVLEFSAPDSVLKSTTVDPVCTRHYGIPIYFGLVMENSNKAMNSPADALTNVGNYRAMAATLEVQLCA